MDKQSDFDRLLFLEEPRNTFDRLLFLEDARKTSEVAYAENPLDADNLTKWGNALLELSQFHNDNTFEAIKIIEEAVSKLKEALVVDPNKHNALWCLGNAYTAHAFLIPDQNQAKDYFNKASNCYYQTLDMVNFHDII
ncbi:mitochondrial import receptor subunit TOM20-like [Impatiens glandulifera]|uniref:mitochondrial import receptor subunit TOM20-like n=1 Tax=Impatiens glandulifera TaxID=253017 RepID=UPI001FB13535|nr:mitochondrial import receptor subunit TOM20-like [Impatiens glandulifera]